MIWNGRACSWIVDKNCIFHQRCFNYAQIFPKNLQTPPDSIILVTMKICMDLQKVVRRVEKCHRRFIEGGIATKLLASCSPALSYTHRPLHPTCQILLCYYATVWWSSLYTTKIYSPLHVLLLFSLLYIALISSWWQTWCMLFTLHFELNSPPATLLILYLPFYTLPSILHTKHWALCKILCIIPIHWTSSRPASWRFPLKLRLFPLEVWGTLHIQTGVVSFLCTFAKGYEGQKEQTKEKTQRT